MINEIRERLGRITTYPWIDDGIGNYIFSAKDNSMIAEIRGWGHLTGKLNLPHNEAVSIQKNTADFISHAPEDIAFLLGEVETLTAELEKERHKKIIVINTDEEVLAMISGNIIVEKNGVSVIVE